MKRFIRLLFLGLLAAAPSCAPAAIPASYTLTPDAGMGLVVFSFSSNAQGMGLFIRRAGEGSSIRAVELRTWFIHPDWENPRTRLITTELPAGSYEIHKWVHVDMRGVAEPDESFTVPFTVTPGRATYIGNVHVALGESRYAVRTFDRSERDLSLLFSRYPALQRESLDVTISPVRY
jgi:hypothetical protein